MFASLKLCRNNQILLIEHYTLCKVETQLKYIIRTTAEFSAESNTTFYLFKQLQVLHETTVNVKLLMLTALRHQLGQCENKIVNVIA